jgi:hypothetical protein
MANFVCHPSKIFGSVFRANPNSLCKFGSDIRLWWGVRQAEELIAEELQAAGGLALTEASPKTKNPRPATLFQCSRIGQRQLFEP